MKKHLLLATLFGINSLLFAQEVPVKHSDPLDISKQMEQIDKYGVPTIETIDEMKNKATALYESSSWKEAATAYEIYAKNANWLANLLSQCVEPYYSASYKEKENTSYSKLKPFIPFETKANECKNERNRAYVKIGLCYKNMGDIKNSVAYLYQGLDLLSAEDLEYWNMAKDALAEILKFNPDNK